MNDVSIFVKAKEFFLDSEKGNVVLLLTIACMVFFLNMSGWELWNPDEPRYAQVAREMRETGEWILPHLNSEIYPDKPPLFFWLIGFFSFFTGGVTEVSARLPSALAAVGCTLLTYFLGKRLFNARAGLIAGLVLVTSAEFFWLGRRANIDMTLTLFILLALTSFYLGLQEKKNSRAYSIAPFLFMGLAVLTKGPVGFLLPSLTIVSFLAVTKNLKHLKRIENLWGLVLFIGIILAWLVPACLRGGEPYTNEILFSQNIDRFVSESASHARPFYYYLHSFPSGFSPWVFLLPGAFVWGFVKYQKSNRSAFYFPFCWFTVIFIFFSLCSGKRELYLLPLYPAAAILLGGFLAYATSHFGQINPSVKFLTVPFYLIGGAFVVSGIGSCVYPFVKTPVSGLISFFPHLAPLALVFLAGGSWILVSTQKQQLFRTSATVTGIMVFSFVVTIEVVLPKINTFKSAKPFSQRIVHHLTESGELVSFRVKNAPFNFYTGLNRIRELHTEEELRQHFDSDSAVLILMREKKLVKLQEELLIPPDTRVVEKAAIGHRTFVLLSKGRAEKTDRDGRERLNSAATSTRV